MYLDNQEKEWLKAIQEKKVKDIQSFIEEYCKIEVVKGNGKHLWGEFIIDRTNMIIPNEENEFLSILISFTKLIEKMFDLGALNYSYKNLSKRGLLPLFRKKGMGFSEAYELLKKYQGYKLLPNQIFNNFIENNFLTQEEKRYYDEQIARKNSQHWTIGIAIAAIIAQATTALTLYLLESTREMQLTNLSQELSYYNAVSQQKIEMSEKIISDRQKALNWLHHYRLSQNSLERQNLIPEWYKLSDDMRVSNSVSLIYALQPYQAILNFDNLFRDIAIRSIINSINDSVYLIERKELGARFQDIIDGIRKNTVGDSAFIIYQSKKYFDIEKIK